MYPNCNYILVTCFVINYYKTGFYYKTGCNKALSLTIQKAMATGKVLADKQTDKRTDRQTDGPKLYAPDLLMWRHNNSLRNVKISISTFFPCIAFYFPFKDTFNILALYQAKTPTPVPIKKYLKAKTMSHKTENVSLEG